jgi:hypothetical protein
MKIGAAAFALILSGCGTVQWVQAPAESQPACTASCNAHYDQCPQIFARFPERGAVECPAEHNTCLKACQNAQASAHTAAARHVAPPPELPAAPGSPAPTAAGVASAVGSKEARLRELKHFHDEGLVTEDVYRARQTAILAEP